MICQIFTGTSMEAVDAFNKWAHGKELTRDVIIHEQVTYPKDEIRFAQLIIIVYHPDTPEWNKTKPWEPIPVRQDEDEAREHTQRGF